MTNRREPAPDEIATMPFEKLAEQYSPLVNRLAYRKYIPGADVEDVKQAVLLTLWRCQASYSASARSKKNGRTSSFTNFFIKSVRNDLWKLESRARYANGYAISYYSCRTGGCKETTTDNSIRCPGCGAKKWDAHRTGRALNLSLEQLTEERDVVFVLAETSPDDPVRAFLEKEGISLGIGVLSPEAAEVAIAVMQGYKPTKAQLALLMAEKDQLAAVLR